MIDGTAQGPGLQREGRRGERLSFPLKLAGLGLGNSLPEPIGLPERVVMVTNDRTVPYESANERGRLFHRTSEQEVLRKPGQGP